MKSSIDIVNKLKSLGYEINMYETIGKSGKVSTYWVVVLYGMKAEWAAIMLNDFAALKKFYLDTRFQYPNPTSIKK